MENDRTAICIPRFIFGPDVLVFHKNNEGNYLMTHHGLRTTSSFADGGGTADFICIGMYYLDNKQAMKLMKYSTDSRIFKCTLARVEKSDNLLDISVNESTDKQRRSFALEDLRFASSRSKEYKLEENRRKQEEEEKNKNQEKMAGTNKFLSIFSKFKSNGK